MISSLQSRELFIIRILRGDGLSKIGGGLHPRLSSVPHTEIDKWLIRTWPPQSRWLARNKAARLRLRSLQLVWRRRCRNSGHALFRLLVDWRHLAITITQGRLAARLLT